MCVFIFIYVCLGVRITTYRYFIKRIAAEDATKENPFPVSEELVSQC
jgi:hypothetical protein